MAAISLKLPDTLLNASRECAEALRLPRAEYIRRAIDRMNRETRDRLRTQRLANASRKVRRESRKVNAEFATFERDPDAWARRGLARGPESAARHRTGQDTPCPHHPVSGSARCRPSVDTYHSAYHNTGR